MITMDAIISTIPAALDNVRYSLNATNPTRAVNMTSDSPMTVTCVMGISFIAVRFIKWGMSVKTIPNSNAYPRMLRSSNDVLAMNTGSQMNTDMTAPTKNM